MAPSSPLLFGSGDKATLLELVSVSIGTASRPTKNHSIVVALVSPFHMQVMSRDRPIISGSSLPVIVKYPKNRFQLTIKFNNDV